MAGGDAAYDGNAMETESFTDADAVREAEEVRTRRAERDAALAPSQRLERVHELCRQLAAIRSATPAGH